MEDKSSNNDNNVRRCGQIGDGDDDVITIQDALNEQARLIEESSAVLGDSDPVNCSYSKGYMNRQAVYACATCNPNGNAGICLACTYSCHEGHDLYELYTKRFFCCDCGNDKFPGKECQLEKNKVGMNSRNRYNHNFTGLYCTCKRPYPDPDDDIEDEMIQCIMCEDWNHGRHLKSTPPDEFVEMICPDCMSKYPFLWTYNLVFSHDAKEDVKSESGEAVDVVSCGPTSTHEDCVENGPKSEPSTEDSKKMTVNDSSASTSGDTVTESSNSGVVTASSQNSHSQPEICPAKRARTSSQGESEVTAKKVKHEQPPVELDKNGNDEKKDCLLKSLEPVSSEFTEHATFWPAGWRSRLCKCEECMDMYRDREIEYLVDESDTVLAYEERGKNEPGVANTEEEDEADLFTGLDRVAQIEVARGVQDLKSELGSFLNGFAREGKVVKEKDIREFFEHMEEKRRSRLNVPQHNCR